MGATSCRFKSCYPHQKEKGALLPFLFGGCDGLCEAAARIEADKKTNYTLGKYANLRLAQERGIDEALKAHSPLQWTAEMNNIKTNAEEIVLLFAS